MSFQQESSHEQATNYEVAKALVDHDLIKRKDVTTALELIKDFECNYKNFSRIFSESLKRECLALISEAQIKARLYSVDIVIATYRPNQELLRRSILSAARQIGVIPRIIISIDGASQADLETTAGIADSIQRITGCTIVLSSSDRRQGVGRCRNRGLSLVESDLYTSLDDDDVFHPLRCFHAALTLKINGVEWLGTGYCRYNFEEKKIYLVNHKISWWGHNSFMAEKSVIRKYGYLAHLERHEDTEFMQRLLYFKAKVGHVETVGHFLHTSIEPEHDCLSLDMRKDAVKIEGHPYLCGSYNAEITPERSFLNQKFASIYSGLKREDLPRVFSP